MTKTRTKTPAILPRVPLGFAGTVLALALPASAADLTVDIRGFTDDTGQAVVHLFSSAEAHAVGEPDAIFTADIVARQAEVRIPDLDGTYAVIGFHDRNGNGRLDTLAGGIALEPHGYSQGAWSDLSRPSWEVAAFSSDIEPPVQLIDLRTNTLVAFLQMLAVGLPPLVVIFAGLAAVRWARGAFHSPFRNRETSND